MQLGGQATVERIWKQPKRKHIVISTFPEGLKIPLPCFCDGAFAAMLIVDIVDCIHHLNDTRRFTIEFVSSRFQIFTSYWCLIHLTL